MLERKQNVLQWDIFKTEDRLSRIGHQIAQYRQEFSDINQQIKMLTPAGVLSRADIYKGIREQGALLAHQQLVFFKVSQLESEQYKFEHKLEEYHAAMILLDKKYYKLNYYLQPLRRDYLRRRDNAAENEIQELAGYGRENF